MRTIRAFITDDFSFAAGGLDLQVGMQDVNEEGLPVRTHAVLTFQGPMGEPVEAVWRWHFITEEERGIAIQGASLHLEEGVGQAMLEALARHYHGTSDTHRMANDLGRERQRRDQAEDRLWEILSSIASSGNMAGGYMHDILFQAVKNNTQQPVTALQFHQSVEFGRCRGHMPWDFGEECRA